MLENYGDQTISSEDNISGPDFFGLYKSEIDELLSQDDSLLPFSRHASTGSCSLFSNGIGAVLSEFKKERLNSLLRESVVTLTEEIDEMENPVFSVCRILSCLRCKDKLLSSGALTCKADRPQHPKKKAKVIPASSDFTGEDIELDEDLLFILENDSTKVEELMERHTSEIDAMLHHMEKKLEEILSTVMTSCRVMTLPEKLQLLTMIKKLPSSNLDRVVEIIKRNDPAESYSQDELSDDLDRLDNTTLWRLYNYVATVQAASTL